MLKKPKTPFSWLAAFALALASAGCGSSEGEPEIKTVQRVGAGGGTLVVEDEESGVTFELRIPAGALDDEQEITVRRVPAAEWPPDAVENPPVGGVFEMLPEGTTFSVPATVVTRFDNAPPGLGDRKRRTLPSHVSRSSSGTVQRHPTTIRGRSDGSTVMVARTNHFSAHWASTQTDAGEFGVELVWPAGPFEPEASIRPELFGVWSSSEDAPIRNVSYAMFVPDGDPFVLYPGFFEVGAEPALDTPIEAELLRALEEEGDDRTVYSESYVLSVEVEYPVGESFVFDIAQVPWFQCGASGVGAGWVVVQTFVPGGEDGGEVPLTYIDEVSFDCG